MKPIHSLSDRILELNTVNTLEGPQRAEHPPQLLGTAAKEALLLETASGLLQPAREPVGRRVMELYVRGMLDKARIPTSKDDAYRFSNETTDLQARHLANEVQTPKYVFNGRFMGTLILRSVALSNQLFMQWLGDNAVHVNQLDEYGFSLLATAAAFGNQPAVKALLAVKSVDPALPCIDGWTPLTIAVAGGQVELVALLASAQDIQGEKLAELMTQATANQSRLTTLINANQRKSERKETLPDLIDQIGGQGQIRKNRLAALNSLDHTNLVMSAEEHERQTTLIDTEFNNRRTALFADLAALVRYGTPINARFYGKKDRTLLHQAATLDQPELISWLLLLGADLDKRDMADSSFERYSQPRNDTALHYGCTAQAEKVILRLLQAGANVNLIENRHHYAAADILLRDAPEMLLKLWPDLVAANLTLQYRPDDKGTLLDRAFAAPEPLVDLLLTMLESGCKHDWMQRKTGNYLHELARFKHMDEAQLTQLVTALIKHNYALEEKDQNDRTPLLAACAANHPLLIKVLLAQQANVNALDIEESGLLHHAAAQSDISCLQIALEQKDLDPHKKNARGQTPIDIAILNGNRAATEQLFTHIAGTAGMQGTNFLRQSTLPDTLFSVWLKQFPNQVNVLDQYGCSLMFTAALFGRKAALVMLLESGGRADLPNRNGMTAFDAATIGGHPEVLELLLQELTASDDDNARELIRQADAMRATACASRSHIDASIATHVNDDYTQPARQFSRELETFVFDMRQFNYFLQAHATPDPDNAAILSTIQERKAEFSIRKKNALATMAHLMTLGSSANVDYDSHRKGHTGLHFAAEQNLEDLAEVLLLLGAEVSSVDYQQNFWNRDAPPVAHYTPLQYACDEAHEKMILLLLQNGASPNDHTHGTQNNTAQLLAQTDSALLARLLPKLQDAGLDLNWQNEADCTLLDTAFCVEKQNPELIKMLLKAGCQSGKPTEEDKRYIYGSDQTPGYFVHKLVRRLTDMADFASLCTLLQQYDYSLVNPDKYGETPLMQAASLGKLEMVRYLAQQPSALAYVGSHGECVLHTIVRNYEADLPMLDFVLKSGEVELETRDHDGFTPLGFALSSGRLEMAKRLLEDDASIENAIQKYASPLHAVLGKRFDPLPLISLILEHDVRPDILDAEGLSALHCVIKSAPTDRVIPALKLLEDAGFDLNLPAGNGATPLHYAVEQCAAFPVIAYLMDNGGRLPMPVQGKTNVLHVLAGRAYERDTFLRMIALPEVKKAINYRNERGNTPLHISLITRQTRTSDVLIEHGADTLMRTPRGRTPLQVSLHATRQLARNSSANRWRQRSSDASENSESEDDPL